MPAYQPAKAIPVFAAGHRREGGWSHPCRSVEEFGLGRSQRKVSFEGRNKDPRHGETVRWRAALDSGGPTQLNDRISSAAEYRQKEISSTTQPEQGRIESWGMRALCLWVGRHSTLKSYVLEKQSRFDRGARR